jgi:Dolichyl-phosphate-mannose-protein mannosyltransferase
MAIGRPTKVLTILALGFALRAAIILTNPIVFGGDTILRLSDRYKLLNGHQLPMLQALIAAASTVSENPIAVRFMMAVIGAIAGLAFYWLAEDLFGEKVAFPAALLFITNPFVLALSTVPFQEILMLAALFLAFHFFYAERSIAAGACLAIACLTRYEAWVACPVLAVVYILRKDRSFAGYLKAALLFGWVPVLWVLAHHGISSPGHFVLEPSLSIWRLQRYAYLAWITVKFTQATVLLLAALGLWRLWKSRSFIDWRLGVQIAFVALFFIGVPFAAQGVPPDPERYVSSREAHIPIYFVLLLAALGLRQWPRWIPVITAASVVIGTAGAWWCVWLETSKPEIQVTWRTARYLDRAVHDHERVLVLAPPIKLEMLKTYLDKARETGGEAGLRQARLELRQAVAIAPDYQRLLVYSRLPRNRLLAPPAACADWVAVWNDYPDVARELAAGAFVHAIHAGPQSVTILRRNCAGNVPVNRY